MKLTSSLLILPAAMTGMALANAAAGQQLWTAPPDDGNRSDGAGVFLNLTATNDNLVIDEIGFVFRNPGVPVRLRVWRRDSSYVGHDASSDGWTVVDQVDTVSRAAIDKPTAVMLNNPISLPEGDRDGFYFEAEIGGAMWTGTPDNPPQTRWEDDFLRLFSDVARTATFGGTPGEGCFSGYIQYSLAPELSMIGECPGAITLDVTGATSGGYVALGYALGTGLHQIPPGLPCSGVTLGLDSTTRLIGRRVADENGNVSVTLNAPPAACGRVFVQAIDLEWCAATNVEAL